MTNNKLMINILLIVFIAVGIISCSSFFSTQKSLTTEELRFCYERELWDILAEYELSINKAIASDKTNELHYEILERLAIMEGDTLKVLEIIDMKVKNLHRLTDVFRVFNILKTYNEELIEDKYFSYSVIFDGAAERAMMRWQAGLIDEEEMAAEVSNLRYYPPDFENYVKRFIDETAVERNDSLRIENCRRFMEKYPASEWMDMNKYLLVVSLLNLERYDEVLTLINEEDAITPVLAHLYASLLQTPSLRKNFAQEIEKIDLLELSYQLSSDSSFPKDTNVIKVMYNDWDETYWSNKKNILEAKAIYFQLIFEAGNYWGDEELIVSLNNISEDLYDKGFSLLTDMKYKNNDYGEIAELTYWKGRYTVLKEIDTYGAEYFIDALIAGAPRKRFDVSAFKYLSYIHQQLELKSDIMDWCRTVKNYEGPVFKDITEEAGLGNNRSSRVTVADYDNDGYTDILFNGRLLYRNNGDMTFTNVTEKVGLINRGFVGGLWADYDKDGHIDIASFSRNTEGEGNTLFRNNGDGTYTVDDRSDINDFSPTEGAAWIDFEYNGFPSLYLANYEQWQVRTGFEDYFRYNQKGVFTDKSVEFGFRSPSYTNNPGLAGRGVSPGDYDNSGIQSIFVSNYRLTRNFLWDYKGNNRFNDSAALNRVNGHLQKGYYGHTIGVDWGDYNNNGNLDLFICNLAHPRFLDFSDMSMLLRNDGKQHRKIGGRDIYYHQFTDVTQEAGITFDELHSDPNWFDTNNNGYLDLYMTSIYENDRSYLYLNNGDGTFTDITFLSGTRAYNGWGNAVADFNNNGRMDLIVGSGSGVKLFMNVTDNSYRSVSFKPYWDGDDVKIVSKDQWNNKIPNSPAFGTKVKVVLKDYNGNEKSLIRELNGGKGTTSQNDQFLHFGIGDGELIRAEIRSP